MGPDLADHFQFVRQLSAFPHQRHDHTLSHGPGGLPVWRGADKARGPWVESLGCGAPQRNSDGAYGGPHLMSSGRVEGGKQAETCPHYAWV